ncbi:MAG: hypothetical protein OXK80_03395 [Bdellovibrionales bacterium]|nr:hypothetical protein [Bdellovibrionales bacterium]
MVKISILAVMMFTAGIVFGGQNISCTFSGENKGTYTAFFNDEEADDLYHQIGDLQAREKITIDSASQQSVGLPCRSVGQGGDLICTEVP